MQSIIKAIIALSSVLTVSAYAGSYYYQCPTPSAITITSQGGLHLYFGNITASTGVRVTATGQSTDPGPATGPSLYNNVIADPQGVMHCFYSTTQSSSPGVEISTYTAYPSVLNVNNCNLNGRPFKLSRATCSGSWVSCRIQCTT